MSRISTRPFVPCGVGFKGKRAKMLAEQQAVSMSGIEKGKPMIFEACKVGDRWAVRRVV